MGIKGLNNLIKQFAISSITEEHINKFSGCKIAIDSEILIHNYRGIYTKNSHIYGFINNIFWYLENNIVPIYVFDGYPTLIKRENILAKRTLNKEQVFNKIDELENKFIEQLNCIDTDILPEPSSELNNTIDELFKFQRKNSHVGKNHHNECKYLLKLMGIPFIVANDDAESFCVTLQLKGIVDYIYTDDSDIFPYLIAALNNNLQNNSIPSLKILRKCYLNNMFTVVDIVDILKKMNLSPKSFVDMCILSGCDFCSHIAKIGPLKAYHYIKKYESIENLASSIIIPETFNYKDARNIFFRSHELNIDKSLNITLMNKEKLILYFQEEIKINPYPIIKKYNKIIQSNKHLSELYGFSSSESINKYLGTSETL